MLEYLFNALTYLEVPVGLWRGFLRYVPPSTVLSISAQLTRPAVFSSPPRAWQSALLAHPFVLIRFVGGWTLGLIVPLQISLAPGAIDPPPVRISRIQMVFEGVSEEEAGKAKWDVARGRARERDLETLRYVLKAPTNEEVTDAGSCRVWECGAMEVPRVSGGESAPLSLEPIEAVEDVEEAEEEALAVDDEVVSGGCCEFLSVCTGVPVIRTNSSGLLSRQPLVRPLVQVAI